MFGNDDDGGLDVGQLLFGLWLWRELDEGRIEPGCIFRSLGCLVLALGGGGLLLILIASATTPRYGNDDPGIYWPDPTPRPAIVVPWTPQPTIAVTPAPTEEPTEAPTPQPRPKPVGKADIRFSGPYREHRTATMYSSQDPYFEIDETSTDPAPAYTSTCFFEKQFGKKKLVLTGFYLESGKRSPGTWELSLGNAGAGWMMTASFDDPGAYLEWFEGIHRGTVRRTAHGFVFDVRMSNFRVTMRVRGTVTCR